MITFPGLVNDDSLETYEKWYRKDFKYYFIQNMAWASLNLISTAITIFAICKILQTTKILS